jgi:hypothetical protein
MTIQDSTAMTLSTARTVINIPECHSFKDDDGDMYYHELATGQTTYAHPGFDDDDTEYSEDSNKTIFNATLKYGWEEYKDDDGNAYYHEPAMGQTTYDHPGNSQDAHNSATTTIVPSTGEQEQPVGGERENDRTLLETVVERPTSHEYDVQFPDGSMEYGEMLEEEALLTPPTELRIAGGDPLPVGTKIETSHDGGKTWLLGFTITASRLDGAEKKAAAARAKSRAEAVAAAQAQAQAHEEAKAEHRQKQQRQ